jgi:hypothetical protein
MGTDRVTAGAVHAWRFFRAGGFDQVRLDTGDDLAALGTLDHKLWSALACPVTGLEFDPKTLALLDADHDGRIRPPEVVAAVTWVCALLKNPSDLIKGSPSLPLAAINDAAPDGATFLASTKRILKSLGKPDAAAISVDDTADTTKVFSEEAFNGDGIVPPEAAADAATRAAIEQIIACTGGEPDRGGKAGVNQAKLDQFFADAKAFDAWWATGEADPAVLAMADRTHAAAAAVRNVKAKVDDYFVRCRLAAFDPRAQAALNREEKDWLALAAKDLSAATAELAAFPIARIERDRPLPLTDGVNPAWTEAVARLRSDAVTPVLGDRAELAEVDWTLLREKVTAYDAWWAAKAGAPVESLGIARVRELLHGGARAAIESLIAQDKALEPEAKAIDQVDKLVRFHRDLYRLLNNFVTFRDFYGRKDKAIFQAGTLYLDSRACELCLKVEDQAKHGMMAGLSRTYLAYCDCVRRGTGEKMTIAAAFTDGDSDNLMVGRNGVFYDRKGGDWDATVVKIIENPISIRQAFWAPYKRILRLIEDQIAKRAAVADASVAQKAHDAVAKHAEAIEAGKPPPKDAVPGAPKGKFDVGTIAALGVAVGGITAALGAMLQAFFGLGIWMPLGFAVIILVISGGSMSVAWLKLRQRNLGPLLDASGWAVNTKALINIPFGRSLTQVAKLPAGAQRNLVDPFAEKKGQRRTVMVLVVVLVLGFLWWLGKLDRWLPSVARSVSVLGEAAPAYQAPPAEKPADPKPAPAAPGK